MAFIFFGKFKITSQWLDFVAGINIEVLRPKKLL